MIVKLTTVCAAIFLDKPLIGKKWSSQRKFLVLETDLQSSSKQISNRIRNGHQLELETRVSSSKPASIEFETDIRADVPPFVPSQFLRLPRTYPNASEKIRTVPSRSKHVRKLQKSYENFTKFATTSKTNYKN